MEYSIAEIFRIFGQKNARGEVPPCSEIPLSSIYDLKYEGKNNNDMNISAYLL